MMDIVIHRVNTIEKLKSIPHHFGVEVDLRSHGSEIIMHHDPFKGGENFSEYLEQYHHGLIVLNIKEAGIENEVLKRVRAHGVKESFLLDVEFPYIYQASRKGERAIAMRYSEDESMETVLKYENKVDWVWIDTNTRLPLDGDVCSQLKNFKTCLVCPERWGRPEDIYAYHQAMNELVFQCDAVMTSLDCSVTWQELLVEDLPPNKK
jgi:hypothetical protein